jgi:hypothetical protein
MRRPIIMTVKPQHGEKRRDTFFPLADVTSHFGSFLLFLLYLYVGLSSRLVRRRHGGRVQSSSSLITRHRDGTFLRGYLSVNHPRLGLTIMIAERVYSTCENH